MLCMSLFNELNCVYLKFTDNQDFALHLSPSLLLDLMSITGYNDANVNKYEQKYQFTNRKYFYFNYRLVHIH